MQIEKTPSLLWAEPYDSFAKANERLNALIKQEVEHYLTSGDSDDIKNRAQQIKDMFNGKPIAESIPFTGNYPIDDELKDSKIKMNEFEKMILEKIQRVWDYIEIN